MIRKSSEQPGCDLLVISPHTDDAEIGLGGTLRLLADRGRKVWVVDLTRGELGSTATPDERWAEGAAAAAVLGLTGRAQLDLPDGFIDGADPVQAAAVTDVVRRLRPRWVVTAPDAVRHPDHQATPALVERACFLARLLSFHPEPGRPRVWEGGADLPEAAASWQVAARFGVCPDNAEPALIFDVTSSWEAKCAALACYASQFARGEGRRTTWINDPAFMEKIERRSALWGARAGVARAEALCGGSVPLLDDLPDGSWV